MLDPWTLPLGISNINNNALVLSGFGFEVEVLGSRCSLQVRVSVIPGLLLRLMFEKDELTKTRSSEGFRDVLEWFRVWAFV